MNEEIPCWQTQKAGSCWQISFEAKENYPTELIDFLEEYFGVIVCNYSDDGLEQYVAYENVKFDEQDFLNTANRLGIIAPTYDISFLESQNWLKDYVIEFAPVEVEEFLIYGIHEKQAPQTDKLALKIYAATAFGSEHQTTKSCLKAISWINQHAYALNSSTGICNQHSSTLNSDFRENDGSKSRSAEAECTSCVHEHSSTGICNQHPSTLNSDFRENDGSKSRSTEAECTSCVHEHSSTGICNQHSHKIRILDVGTGSGILSLAAAKLWSGSHITAVDIDEEAIWVTRQNALDNGLEKQLEVEVSDGYNSDLVKNNAPYDLIFSNILARPLIEMAPYLYKSLKTGGYCILSGFVDDQVDWVIGAHQEQGLKLVKLFELDNWRAAIMEK